MLSFELVRYKRDLIFLDAFGPVNISITDITSSSAVMKLQRPWIDSCSFGMIPVFNLSYLSNGMTGYGKYEHNDVSWFIFPQELDFN